MDFGVSSVRGGQVTAGGAMPLLTLSGSFSSRLRDTATGSVFGHQAFRKSRRSARLRSVPPGVEVPELTARVARASNPAGTTAMWVRDRLDGLWDD